jgi:hypothetical protein
MAIKVNIDLGYEFSVKADFKTVFATLSDVPPRPAFFRRLISWSIWVTVSTVGRWPKLAWPRSILQTIYASKYVSNASKGTVVWTPIAGVGNALVSGNWKIVDKKKATQLTFHSEGELTLPLPGLMKMVVGPVVEAEFEKLVEQYIDNLTKHFGGEV